MPLIMLRFLAGIIVVQFATVVLLVLSDFDLTDWRASLPFIFALTMISVIAAFWLSTLASGMRRDALDRQRESFAREREELRVKAEQAKTRLVHKGRKDLERATRRAESRANRKATIAIVAAGAAGVAMIAASFVTLGMLLLAGAGGAVGGYIAGHRSAKRMPTEADTRRQLPIQRRWLRERKASPSHTNKSPDS
jgi:Flp pilus assembly protein TadB